MGRVAKEDFGRRKGNPRGIERGMLYGHSDCISHCCNGGDFGCQKYDSGQEKRQVPPMWDGLQ